MGDNQTAKPVLPIRFSAEQLAGKNLEPAGRIQAKVRGNPREIISPAAEEARMAVFFERDIVCLVYETGAVKFRSENTLFDEHIQILAGG